MKISICGKGGSGKSILAALLARQAEKDGHLLIDLFGGSQFVRGQIKSVDFIDMHNVILENTS